MGIIAVPNCLLAGEQTHHNTSFCLHKINNIYPNRKLLDAENAKAPCLRPILCHVYKALKSIFCCERHTHRAIATSPNGVEAHAFRFVLMRLLMERTLPGLMPRMSPASFSLLPILVVTMRKRYCRAERLL